MIRAGMEAWNRGDWDEALKEAAWTVFSTTRRAGEWRGSTEVRCDQGAVAGLLRAVGRLCTSSIDEFIEAGEHVVTRQTAEFVGRDGIRISIETGWSLDLPRWSPGAPRRVERVRDALRAAGLSDSRCPRRMWRSCRPHMTRTTGATSTRRFWMRLPNAKSTGPARSVRSEASFRLDSMRTCFVGFLRRPLSPLGYSRTSPSSAGTEVVDRGPPTLGRDGIEATARRRPGSGPSERVPSSRSCLLPT